MNKKTKFVSADEAVKAVRSGDEIVLANFCAEPRYLPMSLVERAHELKGCRIFHLTPFGPFQTKMADTGMEDHIRIATPFCGRRKDVRRLLKEGRADFYATSFAGYPALLRAGDFKSDVLMLTVSPPDDKGYCSLGVSVDYIFAVLERPCRLVLAEINPNMPVTYGRSFIHISEIDYAVETEAPIFELEQFEVTDIERKIGENVATLVDDGSTIQIGYGAISEAAILFMGGKKDLGMHGEMVPEHVRPLVDSGVLNNSRKSMHKGKIVCTFHGGTTELYKWLNHNALIEMQPVDYTNHPRIIAQQSKMVAINAALQVDLFGNIYADVLGLNDQYTGSGGQVDFALGCAVSDDAKFVTTLSSATSDLKYSRIVLHPTQEENPFAPQLPLVSRYLADYVVTEFGIASLKGKTNNERSRSLINIAHPNFRATLTEQARKAGLLYGKF
jgi:4-hydroxybutyrate CoA-transferase